MILELGNFKYDGERFYFDSKPMKFSRMRYTILRLLCENYGVKYVKPSKLIQELYYDIEARKDEPDTESYKVIIHNLRDILKRYSNHKLTIRAHSGIGYTLEYNVQPKKELKMKFLTKKDKERILIRHSRGEKATAIAKDYNINKHRVYDILIRSKQDKLLNTAFGDSYKNYK